MAEWRLAGKSPRSASPLIRLAARATFSREREKDTYGGEIAWPPQGEEKTYGLYARVIEPTPAAMLRPVAPSMLSGCRLMVLFEPPTSTLALAPTPAVAPAVTPP